ncbi:HNH endonuclease signature motif containing protein [Rhodococcus kronopolitis]|uniref:HNH endonuclease signature motif containing protein n=1 Tax=Rhodococcus kronopolitis TaxID=1460226 RepID=A0ABV9FSI0_9NOCA
MALMHGEQHLTCQCPDQACPTKLLPAHERERGKVDVQLHIDLDTLLGLVDDPGFLSGHGPIDPELARRIAEDATWQAIIADARKIAAQRDGDSGSSRQDDENPVEGGESDCAREGLCTDEVVEQPAAPGIPIRYRSRRRTAGAVPSGPDEPPPSWQDPPLPPPRTDLNPEITTGDIHAAITTNPALLDGEFPDGHGGFDQPPRGALTYRPSNAVRKAVFAKYSTCTFPGCTVPTRKCQFDHIVEYDHDDPERGSWTVETNGEPSCGLHHQAKTDRHFRVVRLAGDVIVWIGRNGAIGVTLPDRYVATASPRRPKVRPLESPPAAEKPPDALIYEPTWWESHMRPCDRPPDTRRTRHDRRPGTPCPLPGAARPSRRAPRGHRRP